MQFPITLHFSGVPFRLRANIVNFFIEQNFLRQICRKLYKLCCFNDRNFVLSTTPLSQDMDSLHYDWLEYDKICIKSSSILFYNKWMQRAQIFNYWVCNTSKYASTSADKTSVEGSNRKWYHWIVQAGRWMSFARAAIFDPWDHCLVNRKHNITSAIKASIRQRRWLCNLKCTTLCFARLYCYPSSKTGKYSMTLSYRSPSNSLSYYQLITYYAGIIERQSRAVLLTSAVVRRQTAIKQTGEAVIC